MMRGIGCVGSAIASLYPLENAKMPLIKLIILEICWSARSQLMTNETAKADKSAKIWNEFLRNEYCKTRMMRIPHTAIKKVFLFRLMKAK